MLNSQRIPPQPSALNILPAEAAGRSVLASLLWQGASWRSGVLRNAPIVFNDLTELFRAARHSIAQACFALHQVVLAPVQP